MNLEIKERRRAPRVDVRGRADGSITSIIEASLINLSLVGVLLEHTEALIPDHIYQIIIRLGDKRVKVKAKAVRSFASHTITTRGHKIIIYRTGFEFVELRDEDKAVISDFISKGRGSSTGYHIRILENGMH